ncbi:MAG: hypothetical protein DIZ80_08755 [endosymbiont of Galathealinum brachiosum]|uniref:Squalene cyclase C-terminal domain-containing protein n=1 Tax=endosymbiont of Galathealinum brachiosum TaxID=2200906 RepID=A0A370DBW3_9GAMM|nr:MAG: hypothetical protein DIZ80_08755 [endosymbiont of Galathealinum brachiosum]
MLKKIIVLVIVLVTALFATYLTGVYQNNRDVPYPQKAQMQQQLEMSIQWLVENQAEILTQTNPMLWWMLHEVQGISQDERIANLLEKYHQKNKRIKTSPWGPLFDGQKHPRLGAYAVQGLPYYNQHFIYALNCAADLEDELPIVAEQNTAGFCHQSAYFYRPACITHQLMGINFLFTRQCGLLSDIDEVSQLLQLDIVGQLTWDIRVVDVYLQRVLMLLITGAEASVKPIWIQQVLDHQLPDGGWGDFVSLLGSDTGRSLGFSSKIVSLGSEKSSFHATAQGVYILTYLLSDRS